MGVRPAAMAIAALLLHGAGPAAAQPAPTPTPLVGEVPSPPRPFDGSDGHRQLVYELRLLNATGAEAALRRLAVLDGGTGAPLLALDAAGIAGRMALGGGRGEGTANLGAHQFGVAFLHVRLDPAAPAPASLSHEVEGAFGPPVGADARTRLAPTPVLAAPPPPVLGPPFRGGGYLAGDGCCDSTRHLRALLPLDGAFRLSQRFAIDWERLDGEGRLVRGDLRDPRSYRIYGEPVLAGADATVAEARDGLPDQVPGALPAGLPIAEADGNFVVLDIGGGAHLLYAHLRPGSVRVRAGDRVRRGDPMGEVGNSGNSQAPHLHMHAMDGPSPLLADGIPYVFESFAVTAVATGGTADFDRAEATGSPLALAPLSPPARLRRALPLDLSVVDWGGGP
jgi:peptidase M23-like protein